MILWFFYFSIFCTFKKVSILNIYCFITRKSNHYFKNYHRFLKAQCSADISWFSFIHVLIYSFKKLRFCKPNCLLAESSSRPSPMSYARDLTSSYALLESHVEAWVARLWFSASFLDFLNVIATNSPELLVLFLVTNALWLNLDYFFLDVGLGWQGVCLTMLISTEALPCP